MTNNPTQVVPVEGLADKILWHVEQVCGPLSRDALVVPGDDDHSVLRANILSIIRSSTVNDELVEALRAIRAPLGNAPEPGDHDFTPARQSDYWKRLALKYRGIALAALATKDAENEALRERIEGRVEEASKMFHNSQRWIDEDAPTGEGSLWDWIFASEAPAQGGE